MLKCNPVHDKIVVKVLKEDKTSASGLVIVQDALDQPNKGVVVAVGDGIRTKSGNIIPLVVKVDDKVLFNKNIGQKVKLDNVDYVILKEEEILATLGE
jgi:chaperonin GroES